MWASAASSTCPAIRAPVPPAALGRRHLVASTAFEARLLAARLATLLEILVDILVRCLRRSALERQALRLPQALLLLPCGAAQALQKRRPTAELPREQALALGAASSPSLPAGEADGEEEEEEDDWQVCVVLSSRRFSGELHYLVRRGRRTAPAWCPEEEALDVGSGQAVLAYERDKAARKAARDQRLSEHRSLKLERLRGKQELQKLKLGKKELQKLKLRNKEDQRILRPIIENYKALACRSPLPEGEILPNAAQGIVEAATRIRCSVVRIENICEPTRGKKFHLRRAAKDKVEMVFHCTSAYNLGSILRTGLRIPGASNGVKVANGTAHGLGIYTGTEPVLGYARNFDYLDSGFQFLCCAGLATGKEFRTGSWVVYYNEAHVLPLFLVTCRHGLGPSVNSICKSLVSDLPSLVSSPDKPTKVAYPLAGVLACPAEPVAALPMRAGAATVASATLPRRRVACLLRGDHEAPPAERLLGCAAERGSSRVWYDRQHRTLTDRQLRAMPREAKLLRKQGWLCEPRQDRTRAAGQRQLGAARRGPAWSATLKAERLFKAERLCAVVP